MHFVEIFACIGVGGSARIVVGGPLGDLPRLALVLCVSLDPLEDSGIALARGQFFFQQIGVDAGVVYKMRVYGTVIMVFAVLSGNGSASRILHARQDDVPTHAHARAAGRPLSQVECCHLFFSICCVLGCTHFPLLF